MINLPENLPEAGDIVYSVEIDRPTCLAFVKFNSGKCVVLSMSVIMMNLTEEEILQRAAQMKELNDFMLHDDRPRGDECEDTGGRVAVLPWYRRDVGWHIREDGSIIWKKVIRANWYKLKVNTYWKFRKWWRGW